MHHCSRVGLINLGTLILIIVCRLLRGVIPFQMGFQTSDTPDSAVGMHDPVSAHIPLKVKEKIWRGEYIHFGVLLKSAKELASDSMLDGDLVLKGGPLLLLTKSQIILTIYIIGQQLLSFIWIYC